MRVAILVCVLVVLSGCALPPPAINTAGFVGREELEATGLVREGTGFLKQGRYVDAELSFRRSIYLFPTADNVRENLALALLGSQQFDEADGIFQSLITKYPLGARHRANLAQSYYQQRRYPEAIELFQRALELAFAQRDFTVAAAMLRSLASISNTIGHAADALCYSQEALALKADGAEALSHARILLEHNRYAEVLTLLSKFMTLPSELQVESMRMMALAAYGAEDYQAAWRHARGALDLIASTDPRARELEVILLFVGQRHPALMASESGRQINQQPLPFKGLSQEQIRLWPVNLLQDLLRQVVTVQANS